MADTTQEICRSPAQGQVQHFASRALTSTEETLRILYDVWPSTAGNSPKRWMGSGELGLKIIDARVKPAAEAFIQSKERGISFSSRVAFFPLYACFSLRPSQRGLKEVDHSAPGTDLSLLPA